ncbi:MAG: hypothetical protein ACC660_08355, partial [Acidimicrobiales bacterium]
MKLSPRWRAAPALILLLALVATACATGSSEPLEPAEAVEELRNLADDIDWQNYLESNPHTGME